MTVKPELRVQGHPISAMIVSKSWCRKVTQAQAAGDYAKFKKSIPKTISI